MTARETRSVRTAAAAQVARQRTVAAESIVSGVGFVSGADVTVRFRPAPADAGLFFTRRDLAGAPRIPAHVDQVVERRRRTAIASGDAVVEMTEHILAALRGLDVDNCEIDINASEAPGMDGSSKPFVDALVAAGFVELVAPRQAHIVDTACSVEEGDAMIAIHPGPKDRLEITYNLDYGDDSPIQQSLMVKVSPESFQRQIAPARTFVLEAEVQVLLSQGLGSRATARDLLVLTEDGSPIDNELRFADECVRHKILDVIGDFALFGRPIHGRVLAHKSGHRLNTALIRKLTEQGRRTESVTAPARTLLDSAQIEKCIPHRYPFLFVDRIVELDPARRAVGIKNVSYNEPFFQGHWPGRPVMPGVLIAEAMAQLAGVMMTQWQKPGNYAVLASMDDVKFRRRVVPGDQLQLVVEASRVKSRTAAVRVRATVEGEIAAEAKMSFVLIPADSTGDKEGNT